MSDSESPRETKKKKMCGDRVELDVGGQKFVSAVSTLSSESTYFRSKFSQHWEEDEPCFVDQDPVHFAILLAYMRSGMIHVKDITEGVLAQAVFFGMDRLLAAVKIRAYRKLRPNNTSKSEEEALSAFEEEFGGIVQAISSGVLPNALTLEPEPKKEYASVVIVMGGGFPAAAMQVEIKTSPDNETDLTTTSVSEPPNFPLTGALNKIFFHGFTEYEKDMVQEDRYFTTYAFSRKIPVKQDELTQCFIDSKALSVGADTKKSLALMVDNTEEQSFIYYAPKDFSGDNERDKWSTEIQNKNVTWLVERSYGHREEELERLFTETLEELKDELFPNAREIHRRVRIFSRPL
jgi:hypothetical protein